MSKDLDFQNLLEELTYYKNLTEVTADCIIKSGFLRERGEAVRLCGTFLEVGTVADSEGKQREKVLSANFCRERLCPMCQRRRSLKTFSDFRRLVDYLGGRGWVHVVLSFKNCTADKLSDEITQLYRNSSKLLTKDPHFKKAFKGAVRVLEVTFNDEKNTYHPHLHILLSATKSYSTNKRIYISEKKLEQLWRELAHLSYRPDVYIDNNADEGAVAEIAKYCVKPLQLDLPEAKRCEVLEALHASLHGRRLIQTYGEIKSALRDLKIDLNSDENPEQIVNNTEQMFVYNFELSQYVRRN